MPDATIWAAFITAGLALEAGVTRKAPTADNLLSWLDLEFQTLAASDPHEPALRQAARLLEETNQSDRWTNYLKAVQLIRQTRSKAAVPLLLRYMVLHASFGSDGSVRSYVETLRFLTGEEIANPYRYVKDRVTPVRDGVLDLVQTWWVPEFERITTDLATMPERHVERIVHRLVEKERTRDEPSLCRQPSREATPWQPWTLRWNSFRSSGYHGPN